MRTCALYLCILALTPATAAPPVCSTQEHTKWVAASLQKMQTVKVGMTRADLQLLFTEEGGISTRKQRTYVYRECPYMKVDVQFAPAERPSNESFDKIIALSRPYLAYMTVD